MIVMMVNIIVCVGCAANPTAFAQALLHDDEQLPRPRACVYCAGMNRSPLLSNLLVVVKHPVR